jgi:DNA ligase D-like protein (predicted ligase)
VASRAKAKFIEPMLLLRVDALPDDAGRWMYELKLDGYRAVAFKRGGVVQLRSRNDNDFSVRYPAILPGLAKLPNDTIIDGELVAFDGDGHPSFNALQNATGSSAPIVYFVFDVMMLRGRDLTGEPLHRRRALLESDVLPVLGEPVHHVDRFDAPLRDLVASVKAEGLEGLVAKRLDSRYEAGERSGAWVKMRVNRGQEFVIGGYTAGTKTFDALVLGYYDDGKLVYVARTRNGFTPAVRERLFKQFRSLEIQTCPFVNLPETRGGRWGQGLTKEKMKECRWLKPVLVAQVEFLEWTADNHLRHAKFDGLRTDKPARDVRRE